MKERIMNWPSAIVVAAHAIAFYNFPNFFFVNSSNGSNILLPLSCVWGWQLLTKQAIHQKKYRKTQMVSWSSFIRFFLEDQSRCRYGRLCHWFPPETSLHESNCKIPCKSPCLLQLTTIRHVLYFSQFFLAVILVIATMAIVEYETRAYLRKLLKVCER